MSDLPTPSLPSKVIRERIGDTFRWTFPRRDLGRLHWIGIAFIVGAVAMAIGVANFGLSSGSSDGSVVLLIFSAVFILLLVSPMVLGLIIWKGYARIILTETKLIGEDRCGPFRIRRTCRIDRIKTLMATYGHDGAVLVNGKPSDKLRWIADYGILAASMHRGKARLLLVAYPREWVVAMGETLAQRIGCPLKHDTHPNEDMAKET